MIEVMVRDAITKELKRMGTSVRTFGKTTTTGLGKATKSVGLMTKGFALLGRTMRLLTPGIAGLVAGFLGLRGLITVTRDATKFSRAMSEVGTIVDETTISLDTLREGVLKLARAFGANETKVAAGLYQSISAGVDAATESIGFLNTAMKLGVAGLATTEDSVLLLTSALNAYNRPISEAARFSDVFFKTVEKGITKIPELAQSMGHVIPFAAELGIRIEELAAAVATLTAAGIHTELTVTGLRNVFNTILRPSREAEEKLTELGVSMGRGAIKARGFAGVLDQLAVALEKDRDAFGDIFPNIRAILPVLSLTGTRAEAFAKNIEHMNEAMGATEKAFKERLRDPAFIAQRTLNSLRITFLQLGQTILVKFNAAVKAAGGFEKLSKSLSIAVEALSDLFGRLITKMGEAVGGIQTFIESVGEDKVRKIALAFVDVLAAAADVVGAAIQEVGKVIVLTVVEATNAVLELIHALNMLKTVGGVLSLPGISKIKREMNGLNDLLKSAQEQMKVLRTTIIVDSSLGYDVTAEKNKLKELEREERGFLQALSEKRQALIDIKNAYDKQEVSATGALKRIQEAWIGLGDAVNSFYEALNAPKAKAQYDAIAEAMELMAMGDVSSVVKAQQKVLDDFVKELGDAANARFEKASQEWWATMSRLGSKSMRQLLERPTADAIAFNNALKDIGVTGKAVFGGLFSVLGPVALALAQIADKVVLVGQALLAYDLSTISAVEMIYRDIEEQIKKTIQSVEFLNLTLAEQVTLIQKMRDEAKSGRFWEGFGAALKDLSRDALDSIANGAYLAEAAFRGFQQAGSDALYDLATGAKSAKAALRDFFADLSRAILRAITDLIALKIASAFLNAIFPGSGSIPGVSPGFPGPKGAKGFQNVPGGFGPLVPYAGGGPIVRKPHIAMIGEGQYNEAVVPLPNGRSIPVDMRGGGGGGGPSVQANVTLQVLALDPSGTAEAILNPRVWKRIEKQIAASLSLRSSHSLNEAVRGA